MTMTHAAKYAIYKRDWLAPGAPDHYGKDRRCDSGVKCKVYAQIQEIGKVAPYTEPTQGVVLCKLCEEERLLQEKTPRQFVKWNSIDPSLRSRPLPQLRKIRRSGGFRQIDLSALSGISNEMVKKIERGGNAPDGSAKEIARVLDVTVEELEAVDG